MMEELDLFTLDTPFNIDTFLIQETAQSEENRRAVAMKTRSRIQARRAKSEAVLESVLPQRIEDGDSWHVLSSGDVDSLSFLAHMIKTTKMDTVLLSTWCMAMDDVRRIASWLRSGEIKTLDAYVGEIFPNQYADAHQLLCETIRANGTGRVCVFRNHSKIYLCRSRESYWVIESSANINTNPRVENTVITASKELYLHHMNFFSGVRSFNRDFDDRSKQ